MADIVFGSDGKASFPTKWHGDVTLSRGKWEEICREPERHYYRHNGEKIATALINPDLVRHHEKKLSQLLYYKAFYTIKLNESSNLGSTSGIYFAVGTLHFQKMQRLLAHRTGLRKRLICRKQRDAV